MDIRLSKIAIVMIFMLFFIVGCVEQIDNKQIDNEKIVKENIIEKDTSETISKLSSKADVVFVLTGENFKFLSEGAEAPELRVKKGDVVRIEFTSEDGYHSLSIDEFDVTTKLVKLNDEISSVTFVADSNGTYEYYCNVGNHRQQGMKGILVVE